MAHSHGYWEIGKQTTSSRHAPVNHTIWQSQETRPTCEEARRLLLETMRDRILSPIRSLLDPLLPTPILSVKKQFRKAAEPQIRSTL